MHRIGCEHILTQAQQRRACFLFFGIGDARQYHRCKTIGIGVGLFLDRGNIRAVASKPCLCLCDLSGKGFTDAVLQRVTLAQVVGFQKLQLGNLDVQIRFLFDHGVAAGQRLDFGVGKRLLIHILSRTHRTFAGHDLGNKFLFALHQLIEVGVEGSLGDIAVNIHLGIFIALANDAPLPLLKV